MTGRVCPVHGEWSATGVCRWCEPSEKYSLKSVDALTHQSFIDRTNQAIADLLGPPPEPLPDESAVAKAVRAYYATRSGMAPLFSTRQRYSTPEGIASHNAFWEAKLADQHAALRWERVARRWNYKHHGAYFWFGHPMMIAILGAPAKEPPP